MSSLALDRSMAAASSGAGRRFVVRLVLASILIPISFEIGAVRLTPALIVLMLLFPVLVGRLAAGTGGRIKLVDILFFLFIAWATLAIYVNNPSRVVTYIGQQALVVLGGYLVGRTMILNREDFASFVRFATWTVIVSLPFVIYESITDITPILRFVTEYTSFDTFTENTYEPRMGLYRAQWVFTHPIHYGLFCALIFMLALVALRTRVGAFRRWAAGLGVAIACFFSVSSGPVLSLFLQGGLLATYQTSARLFSLPWRAILAGSTVLYVILELASTKSAFVAVSGRLAFNSSTAFYRTLIWRYGTEQVRRTPIFGNGFNYWPRPNWMTSSVDNYWLAMAMSYGLPALVFFALALFIALIAVNRRDFRNDADLDAMRLAWTISLVGFAMIASTVALWNEILIFLLILFGAGQWMITTTPGDAAEAGTEAGDRMSRYTRFPATATPSYRRAELREARRNSGRAPTTAVSQRARNN